jgi:hypothetical protein
MYFKKLDLILQLAIIAASIIVLIANANDSLEAFVYTILTFYGGFAIWQPISATIHLKKYKWVSLSANRRAYFVLLPFALIIGFLPIAFRTPQAIPFAMITGFAMATFYFIITVIEYGKSKNTAP